MRHTRYLLLNDTTFENFENLVKGKSYSKGFVPCNSKGTNDFRDKKVLAYTINLFPNKEVLDFFKCNNIEINQDLYSLGLNGNNDSAILRDKISDILNIGRPNCKTFLKRLNLLGLTKKDIEELLCKVK